MFIHQPILLNCNSKIPESGKSNEMLLPDFPDRIQTGFLIDIFPWNMANLKVSLDHEAYLVSLLLYLLIATFVTREE